VHLVRCQQAARAPPRPAPPPPARIAARGCRAPQARACPASMPGLARGTALWRHYAPSERRTWAARWARAGAPAAPSAGSAMRGALPLCAASPPPRPAAAAAGWLGSPALSCAWGSSGACPVRGAQLAGSMARTQRRPCQASGCWSEGPAGRVVGRSFGSLHHGEEQGGRAACGHQLCEGCSVSFLKVFNFQTDWSCKREHKSLTFTAALRQQMWPQQASRRHDTRRQSQRHVQNLGPAEHAPSPHVGSPRAAFEVPTRPRRRGRHHSLSKPSCRHACAAATGTPARPRQPRHARQPQLNSSPGRKRAGTAPCQAPAAPAAPKPAS